eukprot:2585683-Pleurochrysis_carterae.AAC.1
MIQAEERRACTHTWMRWYIPARTRSNPSITCIGRSGKRLSKPHSAKATQPKMCRATPAPSISPPCARGAKGAGRRNPNCAFTKLTHAAATKTMER